MGVLVQEVYSVEPDAVSTTSLMVFDDTKPQNTEGAELFTFAMTPTDASNKLVIEVVLHICAGTTNKYCVAALFKDSDADALATTVMFDSPSNGIRPCIIRHEMTAGTASSITFKIRGGCTAAATFYLNRTSLSPLYGGLISSGISIKEIQV